jgi:hypothetical protein
MGGTEVPGTEHSYPHSATSPVEDKTQYVNGRTDHRVDSGSQPLRPHPKATNRQLAPQEFSLGGQKSCQTATRNVDENTSGATGHERMVNQGESSFADVLSGDL